MKENRWINWALNSIKLNRSTSKAQYKCEIQGCRWTSNENLLPHFGGGLDSTSSILAFHLSFDPNLCHLRKMADAPQEQTCYLKTSGWLFEAETERRANKDPNTELCFSFQSGIHTLETTQKAWWAQSSETRKDSALISIQFKISILTLLLWGTTPVEFNQYLISWKKHGCAYKLSSV